MFEFVHIMNQVNRVRVRSITDAPFKWALLLSILGCVAAVAQVETLLVYVIFGMALLAFLVGLSFYCYYAVRKPDYLRSEDFQIRMQSLELLGDDTRLVPNAKEIAAVASPNAQKELGSGTGSLSQPSP